MFSPLCIYYFPHICVECVSGLVVKSLLAMQRPRVRFPADAVLFDVLINFLFDQIEVNSE